MDNHTPVPPIGLNGYNKICFTNSKDAESMLINKPLMPGQLTFAYYYDNDTANGVNVMAAVGTLKGVGENHIFVSYDTINQLLDSVDDSLDDFDTSLIYIRKELMNKLAVLENKQTELDSAFAGNAQGFTDINARIEELINKHDSLKEQLIQTDNKINEVEEKLETKIQDYTGTINDLVDNASINLNRLQKEFEEKAEEILANSKGVYDTLDVSLRNYVNNEMLAIQSFVHNETSEVVASMNTKYAAIKEQLSETNANITDIDKKHNIKEEELNRAILASANEIADSVAAVNASIIEYVRRNTEILNKNIDGKIDDLDFKFKSQSIDLNNKVDEYEQSIKNDIAVFNSSIRTYVKASIATLKTESDAKLSALKTYVTSNDSSIINFVKTLDAAQYNYINKHDGAIKSWIATANSSLYNVVRTHDSAINDSIAAMDARHQSMYRSVESRLDNLIDDISTDLTILVNEYGQEVENYARKQVNDVQNEMLVKNASLLNYINDKSQEALNETRNLNASLTTYVKGSVNDLNASINAAVQHTNDQISGLK